MGTGPRKLPQYVRYSHGAYYYVRWNGQTRKVVWKPLGSDYAVMLAALSEVHQDKAQTFGALLDRFEREVTPTKAAGTRKHHRWQLEALRQSFGRMAPESIKPKHVYRFLDEYGKRSHSSANNCVALLSYVFSMAIRWGILEINPAVRIQKHKLSKRPKRYLTDAEFDSLKRAAPEWAQDVLELTYLTGQRIGDVLALEWSQVKPDAIYFEQQKTKTPVEVEYSPRLEAAINRCRKAKVMGRTVLADGKGQPLGYRRVARMFTQAVIAAKLPHATLHDLRRKAESDSPEESQLLGHKDKRMKSVYRAKPIRAKPPA